MHLMNGGDLEFSFGLLSKTMKGQRPSLNLRLISSLVPPYLRQGPMGLTLGIH